MKTQRRFPRKSVRRNRSCGPAFSGKKRTLPREDFGNFRNRVIFASETGGAGPSFLQRGLAQLARALAWHARGHRFEPGILHFRERRKARTFVRAFSFSESGPCPFSPLNHPEFCGKGVAGECREPLRSLALAPFGTLPRKTLRRSVRPVSWPAWGRLPRTVGTRCIVPHPPSGSRPRPARSLPPDTGRSGDNYDRAGKVPDLRR